MFTARAPRRAADHVALDELPEAREAYRRALEILEAALGPDHPRVARSVAQLADVEREMGDSEAAEASSRRALAIDEAALGRDHVEVAELLQQLARFREAAPRAAGPPWPPIAPLVPSPSRTLRLRRAGAP